MIYRKRKGLTIIEVVLSLVLLAIITVSILPMTINAVKFAKWNTISQNAMNMAYTQIEWLKTLDYHTELELKGKFFPPNKSNVAKEGIVEEGLFMNQENTNSKMIDGIEYKPLTNIYWEEGTSTTGRIVHNALRKVDVTVTARDPFSGKEKEYSILGTLIAFEGERAPNKHPALKIIAHHGAKLIKNVKINILNELGTTIKNWGRTDEKGEAIFPEMIKGRYWIEAIEWQEGEIISQPNKVKGNIPNQRWEYYDLVDISDDINSYVEHNMFVDFPGYIKLYNIEQDLLRNSTIRLNPDYDPTEGMDSPSLELEISLENLNDLKLWRRWSYENEVKHKDTIYKLVEKDTKELWDGNFDYNINGIISKELALGYLLGSLNENVFEIVEDTINLYIVFPDTLAQADIEESIENKEFSLYIYDEDLEVEYNFDEDIKIQYNIESIGKLSDEKNKYKIEIGIDSRITKEQKIIFMLEKSIPDKYGIEIVSDRNFVILNHK